MGADRSFSRLFPPKVEISILTDPYVSMFSTFYSSNVENIGKRWKEVWKTVKITLIFPIRRKRIEKSDGLYVFSEKARQYGAICFQKEILTNKIPGQIVKF